MAAYAHRLWNLTCFSSFLGLKKDVICREFPGPPRFVRHALKFGPTVQLHLVWQLLIRLHFNRLFFVCSLSELCPNFVQTLSKLCPYFVRTLSKLCPNFIRTLTNLCPTTLCPTFFQLHFVLPFSNCTLYYLWPTALYRTTFCPIYPTKFCRIPSEFVYKCTLCNIFNFK
jgi:hypothetical protein